MTSVEVNPTIVQVSGPSPAPVTVDVNGLSPVTVAVSSPAVSVSVAPQPISVNVAVAGQQGIQGIQGNPGPPGTSGGAAITGETPTGVKNGVNMVFTLSNTYITATTSVYRNGLRGLRGYDYTETPPNQITFSDAPLSGDEISVDYLI